MAAPSPAPNPPLGVQGGQALARVSDLGVTLLRFTIGLKLDLTSLLRREVWATALVHATVSSVGIAALLLGLGALPIPLVARLDPTTALLLGFAFCFSSTVFGVKVLEGKGVWTRPGATQFTSTLCAAWRDAALRASPSTPAFAAAMAS